MTTAVELPDAFVDIETSVLAPSGTLEAYATGATGRPVVVAASGVDVASSVVCRAKIGLASLAPIVDETFGFVTRAKTEATQG